MPDDAQVAPRRIIEELRRELDARTAERDEALAEQAANAEILHIINSSPSDLAPVFDAILAKAVGLCESAFGMLLTWDGERFHRAAWQGLSAEQIEATRQPASPAPPPGAPGYRIARGEDVVCIADLAEEAAGGRLPADPDALAARWPQLRDGGAAQG